MHPWEFGARRAKELLFTGDVLTASEAKELGMVSRVVPRADLQLRTAHGCVAATSVRTEAAAARFAGPNTSRGRPRFLQSAARPPA